MTTQELKEQIKRSVTFKRAESFGGQSCGMPITKAHLISDEIGVEIVVSNFRSNLKNRELAFTLFELALDEIITD
jgi:hypothetical protein